MPNCTTISLDLDAEAALKAFALLEGAACCSERVRNALAGLGILGLQTRLVQVESVAAGAAVQVLHRLELSPGLLNLVAAIRAGNFDGQV